MPQSSEVYKGYEINITSPKKDDTWQGAVPALRIVTMFCKLPEDALAEARRLVDAHVEGILPKA